MSTRLLDEMRRTMRRRHYSIRTERSYCSWVKRYILFNKMRSRDELKDGEPKIESFLTHLAMDIRVSPSTQNQAIMWDILHIFIFYLIQPIESENMMNVPNYSVEGIIATFLMCKYEECPLSPIMNAKYQIRSKGKARSARVARINV